MWSRCWAGATLCLLLAAPPVRAAETVIAPDGVLVVNGQRRFVLGLYECPEADAVLQQVSQAGFNLVQASEDVAVLDRLQAHGLFAWINTGPRIDLSADRDARLVQLKDLAAKYGSHPALLAWEVPDEALWNCWYGAQQWRREFEPAEQRKKIDALQDAALAAELKAQMEEATRLYERADFRGSEQAADAIWPKLGEQPPHPDLNISNAAERAAAMCAGMTAGYAALKENDPHHPVWMNHAPRNSIEQLAAFDKAADIAGCDIYPAPEFQGGHSDLADRSLASVGAYTARMQAAAPGKPVWMVLQGFGWADLQDKPDEKAREKGRRPTFDESRFMAYDAIVRGARGLLYWGTYRIEKDSELWTHLMQVVRELADVEPVLAAPDVALKPEVRTTETWGSLDQGLRVLGKETGAGVTWLVVNEGADPLQYSLAGLSALEGVAYRDAAAACEGTVQNGTLTLSIRGHGIHVLSPAKK